MPIKRPDFLSLRWPYVMALLIALIAPAYGLWKGFEPSFVYQRWLKEPPPLQRQAGETPLMSYNRIAFVLSSDKPDLGAVEQTLKNLMGQKDLPLHLLGLVRYNLSQLEKRRSLTLKQPQKQMEVLQLAVYGFEDGANWLNEGDLVYKFNQIAWAQALLSLGQLRKKVERMEFARLAALEPAELLDQLEKQVLLKDQTSHSQRMKGLILALLKTKAIGYPFYGAPP